MSLRDGRIHGQLSGTTNHTGMGSISSCMYPPMVYVNYNKQSTLVKAILSVSPKLYHAQRFSVHGMKTCRDFPH